MNCEQTKACHTLSILSSAPQGRPWPGSLWDTQPVSTTRLYRATTVILVGDFLWYLVWIFLEQKWVIAIHETTNNTVHTLHQYTIPWWLAGFLSNSVQVECHLAACMKTWGLGATNVPDQTVISGSDVTTANFCITNLGLPSILKWAV
jgi:hypothetical protein